MFILLSLSFDKQVFVISNIYILLSNSASLAQYNLPHTNNTHNMVFIRSTVALATLLSFVSAHTTFTNFYIDGKAVTPGKCVRMPQNPAKATNPLPGSSITGSDIACGVDGDKGVEQICDISDGSLLTFNFRACPEGKCDNGAKAVPIDTSHRGTCAVYMKKVNKASDNTNAAGPGWFKIFQHDYDEAAKKWCTDKIIESGGLLSANIPKGLQSGDYLIRTEILALHQADKTPADPQFYVGCAQTHLTSSGSDIPQNTVSIPGYVSMEKNPATLKYHVWDDNNLVLPFPAIGPPIYTGSGSSITKPNSKVAATNTNTTAPTEAKRQCIMENGNWCGTLLPPFTDASTCATSSTNCRTQSESCYKIAALAAVGHANCTAWEEYCTAVDGACKSRAFPGPALDALKPAKGLASITPPAVLGGNASPPSVSGSSPPSGSGSGSTSGSASAYGSASTAATTAPTTAPSQIPLPPTMQSEIGSLDECGARNSSATCGRGLCCSSHGFCGSDADYCATGCQMAFGRCDTVMQPVKVSRAVRGVARGFWG